MSLRTIKSSFVLSIKALARSRLIATLAVLLAAIMLVLPSQLKGDGSPYGLFRLVITWTFGAASAVLCVATVFAGSAAFAADIESKCFTLTRSSPASAASVWFGRWLGIMAVNAVLLATVSVVGYLNTFRCVNLPVYVYRPLEPLPEGVEAETRRIFDYVQTIARIDAPEVDILASIKRSLTDEAFMPLEPGQSRVWRYRLPEDPSWNVDFDVSYMSSYGSNSGVSAKLYVRTLGDEPRIIRELQQTSADNGAFNFCIATKEFGQSSEFEVIFENTERADTGAAVLLRYLDGSMQVSMPYDKAFTNIVHWALVSFAILALLCAVSVSCGCAFSFPVAVFSAATICISLLVASPSSKISEEELLETGMNARMAHISALATAATHSIAAPCIDLNALDKLGDRREIPLYATLRAIAIEGVILPFVLCMLSSIALCRREY